MEYVISIFLLGVIVSFIVIVGLARAAEFSKQLSAEHLAIDDVPPDWSTVPETSAATRVADTRPAAT